MNLQRGTFFHTEELKPPSFYKPGNWGSRSLHTGPEHRAGGNPDLSPRSSGFPLLFADSSSNEVRTGEEERRKTRRPCPSHTTLYMLGVSPSKNAGGNLARILLTQFLGNRAGKLKAMLKLIKEFIAAGLLAALSPPASLTRHF